MTNTTTGRTDLDAVIRLIELRDGFYAEADRATGRENKERADHQALGVMEVLKVVIGGYSVAEEAEELRREMVGLTADSLVWADDPAEGTLRARRLMGWNHGYNLAVEASGMQAQFEEARAQVEADSA